MVEYYSYSYQAMKEALAYRGEIRHSLLPINRPDREVFVAHPGTRPVSARRYLMAQGAPQESIDKVFSSEGFWDPQIKSTEEEIENNNPYNMAPRDLSLYLRKRFAPLYDLIDPSLDGAYKYGFNKHGIEHSDFVADTVDSLLIRAGNKEDVRRRAIIAARIHDLGNILNRKMHPRISTKIAKNIMPELTKDKGQWRLIKQAVHMHEIDSMLSFIDPEGIRNADQVVVEMQERCSSTLLALVIADKIAIGRDRLSSKEDNEDAIEHDVHTQVHLLGQTEEKDGFVVVNDDLLGERHKILWNLRFNPIMTLDELKAFSYFDLYARTRSFHDGFKISVSKKMQERYEDKDIPSPQFQTWQNLFWAKVYMERAFLAIEAAYALFPKAIDMRMTMRDPLLDDESHKPLDLIDLGIETAYLFKRGSLEKMFTHIAGIYGFKRKR